MTSEEKRKFLAIKTYEEFDRRRSEFSDLSMKDPDIMNHVKKIFPKLRGSDEELFKTPRSQGGTIGR